MNKNNFTISNDLDIIQNKYKSKNKYDKDKDDIVKEIISYHSLDYYNDRDLHDIADGASREDEINDYIYEQNYGTEKITVTEILIFKKTSICLLYMTLFPIE